VKSESEEGRVLFLEVTSGEFCECERRVKSFFDWERRVDRFLFGSEE
jgi:hypothetical protein